MALFEGFLSIRNIRIFGAQISGYIRYPDIEKSKYSLNPNFDISQSHRKGAYFHFETLDGTRFQIMSRK